MAAAKTNNVPQTRLAIQIIPKLIKYNYMGHSHQRLFLFLNLQRLLGLNDSILIEDKIFV